MADIDLARLRIDKDAARPPGRRRWWPLAAAALVLVLLIMLFATGLLTPAIEVEVVTAGLVHPSQTLTVLNASGYVVAQRKAAVASKITGRLAWLGVEEGSAVRQGEIIARLEDADLQAAQARAQARLEAAHAAVAQAEAEGTDAALNLRRLRELLPQGFVSPSEIDRAVARHQVARAARQAAEAERRGAEAALQEAQVAFDYTRIRAPFDGVVLTKNADIGDIVTPLGAAAGAQAAVVNMADLDSLQVETDVSESNLSGVRLHQPCEIQLDALPEERFAGAVHMIVPTADRTKATVLVKVRFIERDPRVLPEMSARVAFLRRELSAEERRPRLAVSRTAVVERQGRPVVFRLGEGRVQEVAVETGAPLGDQLEIVRGLEVGDQVVLSPPPGLRDGDRVKSGGT
jgi:RND family efflux transporter MFP subunit